MEKQDVKVAEQDSSTKTKYEKAYEEIVNALKRHKIDAREAIHIAQDIIIDGMIVLNTIVKEK